MHKSFARLKRMLDEREAKRIANVTKAVDGLDPVTQVAILKAARADADYVETEFKGMAAYMISSAIERIGRECRTCPRLRFSVDPVGVYKPCPREIVPKEMLDGAREHFGELLQELDRIVKSLRLKAGKEN